VPERIRLSRAKGWRKPDNTVVVARPTRWGNPFAIGRPQLQPGEAGGMTREVAVARFREELLAGRLPFGVDEVKAELRGRNLACWCSLDGPCHGDVLLEVANS
jgi:hypothetical protein